MAECSIQYGIQLIVAYFKSRLNENVRNALCVNYTNI